MLDYEKTRFRKAEEALRFFFRLHELLDGGQVKRLAEEGPPMPAGLAGAGALDDYRAIGWSMRGLDETALWLLGEIYGPTAFGVRRRTFLHAAIAGRQAVPQRNFGRREIVWIHERALGVVKRGLREIGMIPARPQRAARKQRRAAKTLNRPVYLRVDQSARRA